MPFNQDPIQGYNNWNVNAPYMTPAYMANFRPAYASDGTYNPWVDNPSFGDSASALGFRAQMGQYEMPYGGDVMGYTARHRYNMVTAPMDGMMQGAQSIGIPLASWYLANKVFRADALGSALGRGAGRMAGVLGGSMMRRVGLGAVAEGASMLGMGTAATGLAGFAGATMLPMAVGTGIASAFNDGLINPYISARRGSEAMMANTTHMALVGRGSAVTGGFGMSARRASEISTALASAGTKDMGLDTMQYNQIADNMMQAGIFQEVGDMDTTRIVDGVKKATSVLKMISTITGDPDIQNGVKTLAMLKSGGLDDISEMGAALKKIRNTSAQTGTSVNQILDTVGNQGMVMAQQYGLRGITGLLASSDAYAGFMNARKSGLISGAQMQALGGAEGMTQNAMSGMMKVMNHAAMTMVTQGGGNVNHSLLQNIMGYSNKVSSNPVAAYGENLLNGPALIDKFLSTHHGGDATLKTVQEIARTAGQDPTDPRVLMTIMVSNFHMSTEEARSILEANRARVDLSTNLRANIANSMGSKSDLASQLEQDGHTFIGVPYVGEAILNLRHQYKNVTNKMSKGSGALSNFAASVADKWEETELSVKGLSKDSERNSYVVAKNADDEDQGFIYNLNAYKEVRLPTTQSHDIKGVSRYVKMKDVGRGQYYIPYKMIKDKSHDDLLGTLNRLHSSAIDMGSPEIMDKIYSLLSKGSKGGTIKDAESLKLAADSIIDIDNATKGMITGKHNNYERYIEQERIRKVVESAAISPSVRSIGDPILNHNGDAKSAALDALGKAEGGGRGYKALVESGRFRNGFDPSKSTVDQVLENQRYSISNGGNSAAGKYQFRYATLKHAVDKGLIDRSTVFDKEAQDKLALDYIYDKDKDVRKYMDSDGTDPRLRDAAQNAFAKEWAGVPLGTDTKNGNGVFKVSGKSYYDGVGTNKSNMSMEEARAMMDNMRRWHQSKGTGGASKKDETELIKKAIMQSTLSTSDSDDTQQLWDLFSHDSARSPAVLKYLGIDPKKAAGMRTESLISTMVEKSMKKTSGINKDMSADEINEYISKNFDIPMANVVSYTSGMKDDTAEKLINSAISGSDRKNAIDDMGQKVRNIYDGRESKPEVSDIRYNLMIDLKANTTSMKLNTAAIDNLTKALGAPKVAPGVSATKGLFDFLGFGKGPVQEVPKNSDKEKKG